MHVKYAVINICCNQKKKQWKNAGSSMLGKSFLHLKERMRKGEWELREGDREQWGKEKARENKSRFLNEMKNNEYLSMLLWPEFVFLSHQCVHDRLNKWTSKTVCDHVFFLRVNNNTMDMNWMKCMTEDIKIHAMKWICSSKVANALSDTSIERAKSESD